MAKKANQIPSSREAVAKSPIKVASPWVATNLIEAGDSKETFMTPEKLEDTKRFFEGNIEAVIPPSSVRADCFRPGWVCLYFYPFDIGMTFPFSKLVQELLDDMQISPGQLMPFAWRILTCLDAVEAKHKLGIDVNVIKCCYSLKRHFGCRFGFTTKKALILNVESANDRNWKKDYFFTKRDSLGDGGAHFLDRWDSKGDPKGEVKGMPLSYSCPVFSACCGCSSLLSS